LRKAIALKPDYGVPHYNLGLILADSGDTAEALRELAKAISLLPGQAKPWFDLGRVLRLVKDDRGAMEAVAWAAKLSPSDAAIRSELASLQGAGPLPESAVRQPKVGAASDSAPDHRSFAIVLRTQGDVQGEIGELLRSLALEPAVIEARRALAESYVQLGDKDRAVLEYSKLLRAAPRDVEARIALGRILLARGDAEEARNQLRMALSYQPNSVEARAALDQAEKVFSKP
jgi:tetratricopeptide (TPR) repeat protein